MRAERKKVIIAAAAAVFIIAVSVLIVFVFGLSSAAPHIVLADVFIILGLSIWVMVSALRRMLQITLYSYLNIGLIGGIIFAAILQIVLIVWTVKCIVAGGISMHYIFRTIVDFPRHFSFYSLFVIFAVSVLVGISNISLIRHEGFCLNNALSIVMAGFYIIATLLVYLVSHLLSKYVFILHGYNFDPVFVTLDTVIPMFLLLLLCYLECIFAGTAIMGWKAARQIPKHDKDYIIILGCSIDKRGGLLPLLKGRVNRAIRFAWEQEMDTEKPLKYVPSGGQGANEIMSEGSAMELYLMSKGAEDYEIFPEKKSVNTWENMTFSKEIIDSMKPDAKVAFATTNYHILRSGILARRAGLDAEGIAGDTKWYFWPNGFVREFFGILAMNIKAHVTVAWITAVVCVAIGCIGYFGALI